MIWLAPLHTVGGWLGGQVPPTCQPHSLTRPEQRGSGGQWSLRWKHWLQPLPAFTVPQALYGDLALAAPSMAPM